MDSTEQASRAWAAPRAHTAVDATVELPGSKSITNRALVIAALADGPSRLIGPLQARDTQLMAAALHRLGVRFESASENEWTVTPGRLHSAEVDVGLAGTVMRFLPPLAALAIGQVRFDGDRHARERPMATTIEALRQLGVRVTDDGANRLPFVVDGRGSVRGGTVHIDASASSQFVSGLLLSGARFDDGVVVVHNGRDAVPSAPHLAMTLGMLAEAGVSASRSDHGVWQVMPGVPAARDWVIEPDLSNAAPFLAAALVTSGTVTVPRWPQQTTQAGDTLRGLLAEMGGEVTLTDAGLTVRGTGRVHALTANLGDVGELVPVLAALCALADGPSRLTGIGHLRGHETDRIAALATELTAAGCEVRVLPDGLGIKPRPMHGGHWRAYADHRMATAGAVIGLAVDGIVVDDIGATSKTMPGFPDMWSAMLAA